MIVKISCKICSIYMQCIVCVAKQYFVLVLGVNEHGECSGISCQDPHLLPQYSHNAKTTKDYKTAPLNFWRKLVTAIETYIYTSVSMLAIFGCMEDMWCSIQICLCSFLFEQNTGCWQVANLKSKFRLTEFSWCCNWFGTQFATILSEHSGDIFWI